MCYNKNIIKRGKDICKILIHFLIHLFNKFKQGINKMENNETTIVKKEAIESDFNGLTSYCSFTPKTMEEKKKLYNTMSRCDVVLNDIVGTEVTVKDIFISEYIRKDKQTGEELKSKGHRVVLFDEAGKTYITLSNYFYNSLAKLCSTFGTPDTWTEPLIIKITKTPTKNGGEALGFELV